MRTVCAVLCILACVSCAHTSIRSHPDDECGEFESSDTGLGVVVPPGDQYGKYRGACATHETVKVLAEARRASVAAAYEAAAAVRQQRDAPENIAHTISRALDVASPDRPVRVTVLAPACDATRTECALVRNRIESALVRIGTVMVVEDARADELSRAVIHQQSDVFDDASIAALGRTLGATHALLIDIAVIPNRAVRLLDLNARCIAMDTGSAIAATGAEFTP